MPGRPSSKGRSPPRSSCCGCWRSPCTSAAATWSGRPASSPSGSGADLWWIIYIALRDLIVVQVFLGSFIFFYPDVVSGRPCRSPAAWPRSARSAVLLIKLIRHSDETAAFRWQLLLLGLGATLYVVPYLLGVQMTELHGKTVERLVPMLVSEPEPRCRVAAVLPLRLAGRRDGPVRRLLQPALDRSATGRERHGGDAMTPR